MATTTEEVDEAMIDPVTGEMIDHRELAETLLAQAKEQGVSLVGPGGLLSGLTKTVLEAALNAELTEHLGHEHGATPEGTNMHNGTRPKTVLTQIGPVEIQVLRDRDATFEPVIVPKRKRRLDGVDQIVLPCLPVAPRPVRSAHLDLTWVMFPTGAGGRAGDLG